MKLKVVTTDIGYQVKVRKFLAWSDVYFTPSDGFERPAHFSDPSIAIEFMTELNLPFYLKQDLRLVQTGSKWKIKDVVNNKWVLDFCFDVKQDAVAMAKKLVTPFSQRNFDKFCGYC